MHAIKLAISADFLQGFSRLGKQAQKKVRSFIDKFRADPTNRSLNYKSLEGMRDAKVRSARVTDKYRAIIIHPPKGDVYLLAWVDNHDEAMDWARNKVFEVNRYTGTFQVYEPTETVPQPAASEVGAVVTGEKVREGFLLAGHSDEDLLFLGVPEPLLPAVRSLRTERDLDNLVAYLPAEAADALAMLAAGFTVEQTFDDLVRVEEDTTPVATAVAEAREREPVDQDDFAAALNRKQSLREFKLLEDDEELAAMLAAPLEHWRVFLHPSQASFITMKSKGEARVLGGAGTGKTVVAMHRARYLAKKVFTKPEHRILITTFTKNLAADIRHNMDHLCGPERERIEVKHISKVASDILRGIGLKLPRRATPTQQNKAWERTLGIVGGDFERIFYTEEWDKVVQAQDVTDLAGYYKARRAGRGKRLTRRQRNEVWKVLACYREQLDLAGLWEHADVIREARLALESSESSDSGYTAVIADEIQDFRTADLKFLRALVPEGPNDVFVVGDPHQRIYGHKASLSRCGINIRGRRSRKLRLNYRTTHEIRNWAVARLKGLTIDDLDEGEDNLKGERSLRSGAAPTVRRFKNLEEEVAGIVAQIKAWQARLPDEADTTNLICLVARTHQLVDDYAKSLKLHGIDTQEIQTDSDEASRGGVRVATMHRVKGLEFPYMVIAGVDAKTYPYVDKNYENRDEVRKAVYDEGERKLMYVSATRARDELLITGHGIPSPWLDPGT